MLNEHVSALFTNQRMLNENEKPASPNDLLEYQHGVETRFN